MASTVIDADSGNWTLIGDVRLTTRAAIAQWCPPPAGTENDPIILTHDGNGGLATPRLRFQAAALIAYGAIIGDLEGNIIHSMDDAASSLPLPAEDIAAAESHSAAGDAACGLVIGRGNNLDPGEVHRFEMSPMGDLQFAIFNVELFQQPFQTTPAGGGVSTTPTSASKTSSTSPSTTSSETSGAASSIGTIKPPTQSSIPIAAIIIPIVVGLLMLLALVAFLLFRRRRRRRRPIPPDFTVDSFDSAAPLNHMSLAPTTASANSGHRTGKPALSDSDDTRPYTITSLPSTASDPHARTDEKFRLLHVTDPKGWQGQGSGSTSPGLSTPGMGTVDLDAPPSGSTARGEDVVQMQALSEAMQRAGFSPAALLESLNRVHERADDEGAALETTTEARTRPPQYRE